MRVGLLHSVIRLEEKMLLDQLGRRGVDVVPIDDRAVSFTLGRRAFDVDVILERSINHSRALHALRLPGSGDVRAACGSANRGTPSKSPTGVPVGLPDD